MIINEGFYLGHDMCYCGNRDINAGWTNYRRTANIEGRRNIREGEAVSSTKAGPAESTILRSFFFLFMRYDPTCPLSHFTLIYPLSPKLPTIVPKPLPSYKLYSLFIFKNLQQCLSLFIPLYYEKASQSCVQ